MALSYQYRVTDTGGGSSGDNNRSQIVKANPVKTPATIVKTPVQTTPKKTIATKNVATKTVATTPTPAAKKTANTYRRPYTPYTRTTYPTYTPSAPAKAEEDNFSKNWNSWITNMNNAYNAAAGEIAANAQDYKNRADANLNNAENRWNTTYSNINNMLNDLASSNKQREQATLDAINGAYNSMIGNAGEYYNNLMDTYNRSMGYVDEGYNEGVDISNRAKEEALQLAENLYNMGEQTQNRQTERDLRGQYISYMNGLKNLGQQLAARGINGGATETSLLSALNGYESNRTDLEEARLAALGQLRQQQMQSGSEAEQAYLAKVADLVQNRTANQLGVENNRSQGEYNYANMKNEAESNKSNQLVSAQNNFQNWAANLASQRSSNETSYADAIRNLADSRNGVLYNGTNLSNQASQLQIEREMAEAQAVAALSEKNKKAKKTQKKANKNKTTKKKKK